MIQKIDYRLPLILIGGFLFQFLFWDEFLGLNLLLYSLFVFAITFTDKQIPFHKTKLYTAIPHLAIAIYVTYNNSVLAIITWFITLLVFLGAAHFVMLKSATTALVWGFLQVISGPSGIIGKLRATKIGKVNIKPVLKPIKYIVMPLLMVIIFCSLYSLANPIFAKYVNAVNVELSRFFSSIFRFLFVDISFAKLFIITLGCCITAGIMVTVKSNLLEDIEIKETDELTRKRRSNKSNLLFEDFRALFAGSQTKKLLALKTENIIGIISFVALNILLLFLNGIDVSTLWLNNNVNAGKDFSAELHDGTNTLIFSIVIAMLIVVYFFSGNLNFYSKNKFIKALAYVWIAQNAFLVLSVFHRDYDYIFYHGLTHKRIGVAVFATLSMIGLLTVYLKIARQRTIFFLYRINSKVWYVLLVVLSFVNWDVLIVRYNFANADKIGVDVDHLMSFSDKTLPLLVENRELLLKHAVIEAEKDWSSHDELTAEVDSVATGVAVVTTQGTNAAPPLSKAERKALAIKSAKETFNQRMDNKIEWFLEKQKTGSWLSFSYVEWEAAESF
ncbi:MAG: DUF4173 domain-containing protein [Pedobacter sp.]|uniref:DUF4153 domain-containing protein n=1 Tax=Pedobacter sp. TaxID=1411316 RepID=UPI002809E3E3|nr:DUF4173 domain-containing protein [Pedobacter sp.]MDQ8005753.1 DUF4173 domain-containing protein [Pedobacter sp.]